MFEEKDNISTNISVSLLESGEIALYKSNQQQQHYLISDRSLDVMQQAEQTCVISARASHIPALVFREVPEEECDCESELT